MEDPTANKDDWIQERMDDIADRAEDATEAANELVASEASLIPQGTNTVVTKRKSDSKWIRRYLLDVYSVLDYIWHLLYDFFSTDGQRKVTFPYRPKGIKVPQDPSHPNHDGQGKYLKDILNDWDNLTTDKRKKIGDIILSIQPRQEVNSGGALVGELQYQPYDKEVFAILHCCRNRGAHRGSIRVYSQDSFVEVCQREGTLRLITADQRRNDSCCIYMPLDKPSLWMRMPAKLSPSISKRDRPVVALIDRFHKIVTSIADGLLHSTNLLPQNKTIWKQSSEMQQYRENWPDLSALNIPTSTKIFLLNHLKSGSVYVEEEDMKCLVKVLRKTPYAKRIFGAEPKLREFNLIKYKGKDGSREYLRMASKGGHRWRDIATTLFPDYPTLANDLYRKHCWNQKYCFLDVLQDFLTKCLPDQYTRDWNGIIDLFEDLDETTLAEEITEAVLNKED